MSLRLQFEERYDTDFSGGLVVKTLPSNAGSADSIPGCFPDSSVGKECACNAGDPGSIPGSGRSPGEGIGYPLQYSGLENSGVAKSRTGLSDFHYHWGTKNARASWLKNKNRKQRQ